MKSRRNKQFRAKLKVLPKDAQRQAYAAYRLFRSNPYHPSLQFKQVSQTRPLYSVRIGTSYRALGFREDDDLIIWIWIGTHAEYNKLVGG